MQSFALFLLCQVQDYVKYATPGWQDIFDPQAVMQNNALNLLAIMLPSFRASREGEQHANHLSQRPADPGALSL